ncbi:T9SS type A sorting domain-containing protein [Aquimarina rhabdastrellae]
MKIKNVLTKQITFILLMLLGCSKMISQDINFTFANAQVTSDGVDHYYDADIMIASTIDFKLGSGQLYLTYNTAAFGENIHANNAITYSQPNGTILAEEYGGFEAYKDFIQNDNTSSRVSLAFQQGLSAGAITTNNVTATPRALLHIRIKFIDVNEEPMIAFETGAVYLDQFYTACGPTVSSDFANCTGAPGMQLINDTFDSTNSPDTTAPVITLTGDNPQEILLGSGYTELGATTDDGSTVTINDSAFVDAIGAYTIYYDATDIVGNTAMQVSREVNVVTVLSVVDHELNQIQLTPNPVTNHFKISGISNNAQISIYDMNGRNLKKIHMTNDQLTSVEELPIGVYFVRITQGNERKVIKVVKN